LKHSLHLI